MISFSIRSVGCEHEHIRTVGPNKERVDITDIVAPGNHERVTVRFAWNAIYIVVSDVSELELRLSGEYSSNFMVRPSLSDHHLQVGNEDFILHVFEPHE